MDFELAIAVHTELREPVGMAVVQVAIFPGLLKVGILGPPLLAPSADKRYLVVAVESITQLVCPLLDGLLLLLSNFERYVPTVDVAKSLGSESQEQSSISLTLLT